MLTSPRPPPAPRQALSLAALAEPRVDALARFDMADAAAPLPRCDVLVAGDAMYTRDLAAALGRRCAEALRGPQTTRVLVADAQRYAPCREAFLAALRAGAPRALADRAAFEEGLLDTGGAVPARVAWLDLRSGSGFG